MLHYSFTNDSFARGLTVLAPGDFREARLRRADFVMRRIGRQPDPSLGDALGGPLREYLLRRWTN